MREIKFRAWDGEVMHQPCDVLVKRDGDVFAGFNTWEKSDFIKIMQFTGLKDKNGKEIYEGDIVKVGNIIGQVKYCEDRFLVCYGDVGKCSMTVGYTLEVIGNIYQTPELVEVKP